MIKSSHDVDLVSNVNVKLVFQQQLLRMGNFVLFYCNMRLNELRISEIYIMILRYCNIAILWYHSHIIELLHPIVSAGPPGRPANLPWQNTVYISPHSHNWLELIKVNADYDNFATTISNLAVSAGPPGRPPNLPWQSRPLTCNLTISPAWEPAKVLQNV